MNTQIYQEASDWLVLFRTGTPDANARAQLDAWLRKSPEHVRAYLEVTAIWEDSALADPERETPAEEHIARARAEDSVVPLPTGASRAAPRRAFGHWAFLVAASLLILAASGIVFWDRFIRDTYSTGTGEQRSVTLVDGSVIDLNARTRIRVSYSGSERVVNLLDGQALFHVAKDAARPFIVRSAETSVRAVGTQFDVYRKPSGVIVTVIEGRVAISAAQRDGSPSQQSVLAAGEQISITPEITRKVDRADVSAATAWTRHRLVFNSVPLREVINEFNRYNTRELVIEAPELESFEVVGVFSSTDPRSLLRFLNAQPGIAVEESEGRVRITRR
jgi:transmembrane sensor